MELKSPEEVAQLMGVTKRTVLNWFHEGRFPNAFQIGERIIRIPLSDLEAVKEQPFKKESA